MSRESGHYPPGAEFDPRAPWNEKDPEPCPNCKGDESTFSNDGELQNCDGCGFIWTPKDRQGPDDEPDLEPDAGDDERRGGQ